MKKIKIGIIGGSGLYNVEEIKNGKWREIPTPYGKTSDQIFVGTLNGIEVCFLPRHGRGHVHSPSSVPYLANVYALKLLGVTDVISFSAVGSLQERFKPGDFIIVDQFIDRTFKRKKTFFSEGCVAHVSLAKPVCNRLGSFCTDALSALNINHHFGGTYLAMEGPQFSTLAESLMYKNSWSCDVIGMTNMPEANLFREAEICYVSIGMVTDYDCWHPNHEDVKVSDIISTLSKNVDSAKSIIIKLVNTIDQNRNLCEEKCDQALEHAIITDKSKISADIKKELSVLNRKIFEN